MDNVNFSDFNFSEGILNGVKESGFKIASPIQALAIPKVLEGKDLVAQAHTGTGKTAAFGLPVMNMLSMDSTIEALVITPTRELATQVSDELYKLGKFSGVRTATVYGGESYTRQLRRIERGVNMLIATPGRLLDLLKNNRLDNLKPKFVILDEADEMLDMGFLEDIKSIFAYLPKQRQTLLFSATMPQPIKNLANSILKEPEFISVTKDETTNVNIEQKYYVIQEYERDDALTRVLDSLDPNKLIIFCRMKREVDRISTMLIGRGYSAKGLHGDMEQRQREEVIKSFKSGNLDILIATDVAARGLDVSGVSHVLNYHIPFDPESYVHRIGRTGRGGESGIAITFVTPLEFKELSKIKDKLKTNITQSYIPTVSDLKETYVERFIDKVRKQQVNTDVAKIYDVLKDEVDAPTLCFKLLSMLIEEKSFTGPNEIGVDDKTLKAILQKQYNERRRKSSSRRDGGGNRRGRYSQSRGRYNSSSNSRGRR